MIGWLVDCFCFELIDIFGIISSIIALKDLR